MSALSFVQCVIEYQATVSLHIRPDHGGGATLQSANLADDRDRGGRHLGAVAPDGPCTAPPSQRCVGSGWLLRLSVA